MMKSIPITTLLVSLLLSGCARENEQVVEPNKTPTGVFSLEVKPILDRSCGGSDCHGGGPRGFAGGLDLTSYEGIFRGSKYGTVVVSGTAYMSHLVQSINQTDTVLSPLSSVTMPASRDPLPSEDIQTIVRWIRDGAQNDNGSLPFPEPRPLGKVFFTCQAVDLVGVLDIQTGLIMRYVSVGNPLPLTGPTKSPHNVQIDDQGRYYYVTLVNANVLKKYDAVTNALLGEVNVGIAPAHVVITHDGSKAYVTNFNQAVGQVYVVNTATMTVTKVIASSLLMKATHGLRLSHDGKYLYAGNNGDDFITVVRTSNDSVVATLGVIDSVRVPVGSFTFKPYQVAVRADDRFVYVTCNGRGYVSVIERIGDTFVWRDTIRVGQKPLQCEVTPDGRFLYVCNQGSGSVSVINAQTNQLFTTINNVGKQPHGVDITGDSRTAYVTCENNVGSDPPHHPITGSKAPAFLVVIDVGTNQVIRRIEVGGFAAGVSIFSGTGN
jgi:YVTN family beta-propeller protein